MMVRDIDHISVNTGAEDGEAPAEAALLPLLTLLQSLLGAAATPMAFWDRRLVLRWVNQAYLHRSGQPVEAIIGRSIVELWPGAEANPVERYTQVLAGVPVAESEAAYRLADGQMSYWALTDTPVRDAHGTIVGVLSMAQDITQGVTARQQAEAARQRLRAILNTLPLAISVWQADRRLEFMNTAATAYWQRVDQHLAEGDLPPSLDLRHLDGRPLLPEENPLYQVRQTGEPRYGVPIVLPTIDGTPEPVLVSAIPLPDEASNTGSLVVIGQDPRPEWERQRLAQQAETMAELARLKTHLLACVSHELRTPLGHITGYADALLRSGDMLSETERLEFLQVIRSAADQLQRLIGDLLDASHIEAGQLPIVLGTVDLPALAGQVVERACRAAPERRLTLAFPPTFPPVPGDAGRVEQVLENLVGNALRHAPGAAITIGGRVRRHDVEMWVRDTGPGFPPAQTEQPFAPLLGRRQGSHQGLGLGLSICRGIVEAHGGSIWLAPRRRGTAIHLRLPRRLGSGCGKVICPSQPATRRSRQRGEGP